MLEYVMAILNCNDDNICQVVVVLLPNLGYLACALAFLESGIVLVSMFSCDWCLTVTRCSVPVWLTSRDGGHLAGPGWDKVQHTIPHIRHVPPHMCRVYGAS